MTGKTSGKPTKAYELQQALAADIIHGRLPPGMALDETSLARDFGVSRTPVREAIRQLQVAGLVEAKPHCSAVVTDIPQDRLDDMFSVMAELESLCARWSASAMSSAERRHLREIFEASAACVRMDQREAYIRANDAFHETIYDGAHSPFLADTTRHVRIRLAPFRRIQFQGDARLAKSHAEHGRVVAAIERGDGERAATEMRLHIGVVRNAVQAVTRPAKLPRLAVTK